MTVKTRTKQWWKHAVVYQIYPASYCDSNGDGVGDLAGITSKLDYIANLGVNVIWICPMYDSPQVDMGYDISNYEDVYAPYGTLQDMETLIREAHARDIRVMLDLVINHSSDKHAWFQESRSSKTSPKRDWYTWRPAKYSDSGERLPPNNWRCNFGGGSVWEWDEQTGEYYLHLFAKEQPDLNWENPETRKAIYASAMEFWLERGVDGFRIDTVNMYSKPIDFPDAPIIDPKAAFQPAGLLYCNGPRMHEFLDEMNAILTKYGAITVGELPNTPDMARVLRYVSAEAKQLDMVFQFDVVDVGFGRTHKYETTPKNYVLRDLKDAIGRTQSLIHGTDAWTTVFMENHDQARSVSRFTDDRPEYRVHGAKMLALFQSCLSGTQYVYQGQEIGTVNAPKESYPLENYLDLDSYLFVDMVKERCGDDTQQLDTAFNALQHLARDHSRIPVAWNGKAKYGGFSEQAEKEGKDVKESWMKPHPLAGEINVASQLDDPTSVLAFWRKMLQFRREHPDLFVYGDYRPLQLEDPTTFTFVKEAQDGGAKAVVVLNFSTEETAWTAPNAQELGLPDSTDVKLVPVLSNYTGKSQGQVLAPFEGRVYLASV
ncbi:family 13 glycoside hydrolase [Dactylonectria estremocensis]|uniref:Family 13 glycoside hydrolase n=1 Tax=Dactylonectria estremocensis TaxID=1079267 RepID=A0A9P9DVF7_9HYPO|nr:family 13 glycoside hydrolase [Dactylonectria estremocensis]